MDELIKYLKNTVGEDSKLENVPNDKLDKLPFYLREIFRFQLLRFMNQDLLLAELKKSQMPPMRQLQIHLANLRKIFILPIAFLLKDVSAVLRNKLVGSKVNFIVPGKQLFLPDLMMDLKEQYKTQDRTIKKLLPSAQVVLFYWILRKNNRMEELTFQQLANELRYTPMAITNAIADLQRFDLCKIVGSKGKHIRFEGARRELWDRAQPFLINPIRTTLQLNTVPQELSVYRTNISALAHYTNIAEGDRLFIAVEKKQFAELPKYVDVNHRDNMDDEIELELWKYNPGLLTDQIANSNFVDPLSLYLTLLGENDERVNKELKNLLRDILW
ncbi:MAG: hypothetical protein M0R68_12045 [Bacteroidetes bacterium]|nr:hypothetical protein [Bacteroidota bacterium]